MTPYIKLLQLPLFQGLSQTDLLQIIETTPIAFETHHKGNLIAKSGKHNTHLICLLDGIITSTMQAHDHGYKVTEELHAQHIIEIEQLFGLQQRYARQYEAQSKCSTIAIEKAHVVRLIAQYEIVRINLLNILSTLTQRAHQAAWQPYPTDLSHRIVRFFLAHCLRPAGKKTFNIKMMRLANELNDSRLNVSKALNHLQDKQLISLTRGYIFIEALEKLITYTEK